METFYNPAPEDWPSLSKRPSNDDGAIRERVEAILARVKQGGDEALRLLSEEIEGRSLPEMEVCEGERSEAVKMIPAALKSAIIAAAANIEAFHKAQVSKPIVVETIKGVKCIQKPVPIAKVGLYIPGGTAPLFSTVLMLAIPARIAGCREVVLCTPAGRDGKVNSTVLYAASFCGIRHIFKIGGAQAIAAMAYGTESIPKLDKIFGPGNRYVTMAKQILSAGTVAIDMPAGPSEVMVIADEYTNPAFAAADLLSQAEHGSDSQVMLVTNSSIEAKAIQGEIERQKVRLGRASFVDGSLGKSRTIVFDKQEDILAFANTYAPEHLIIATCDPWAIADKITAAGSVFIGAYSPESAGDYASGTNHTLPTSGWARSFSGVNIDSFTRKMTLQEITRDGLCGLSGTIVTMAEAEGLEAHANAVKVRITDEKQR